MTTTLTPRWPQKAWPATPLERTPQAVLMAAMVAGVLAAALWRPAPLSVGYLFLAIAMFAVAFGSTRCRPSHVRILGIATTLVLMLVPATRAAEWLGVLCVLAAFGVAALTFAGGRTWTATLLAVVGWVIPARAVGWSWRRVRGVRVSGTSAWRSAVVVGATVALAVVFGALFAGADAAFANLLDSLTPSFDVAALRNRLLIFGVVTALGLGAAYLVMFRPTFDAMAPARGTPLRRWEWALPIAVLDAIFLAFVLVQLTVLFGGNDHVLTTAGLTYAEYARQGFWQLLWVTGLTLAVLAVVLRKIPLATSGDRLLARGLVGMLCVMSLVVVASAVSRMRTYEQAYGFTVLRVFVSTVEFWLGSIFVMIGIAGVRMSARWLPRAVVGAAAAALLTLAVLNPDRYIAERNIDRYEESGRIDLTYLSGLSADAVPALDRLPEDMQRCVAGAIVGRIDPDPWYGYNRSRALAVAQEPQRGTGAEHCGAAQDRRNR